MAAIKPKDLRELSIQELEYKLKEVEYQKIKASSIWGKGLVNKQEAGIRAVGASAGENTKLLKNIRKTIARIQTIINEKKKNKGV